MTLFLQSGISYVFQFRNIPERSMWDLNRTISSLLGPQSNNYLDITRGVHRCHNGSFLVLIWSPGAWFNIKMPSCQYRKSNCGDKTILRSSHLHNWISTEVTWHHYIESWAWTFLCIDQCISYNSLAVCSRGYHQVHNGTNLRKMKNKLEQLFCFKMSHYFRVLLPIDVMFLCVAGPCNKHLTSGCPQLQWWVHFQLYVG